MEDEKRNIRRKGIRSQTDRKYKNRIPRKEVVVTNEGKRTSTSREEQKVSFLQRKRG